MEGILQMAWNVEYTNEFEAWWMTLTEDEQVSVVATRQAMTVGMK